MAYDDWNPDDFLDFDYGNKGSSKKNKDNYSEEYNEYLASRKADKVSDTAKVKKQRKSSKKSEHSQAEKDALKKAQLEADKRYRSNYNKNTKKATGKKKTAPASVWLTRLYLLTLVAFLLSMGYMDVLPLIWLIVLVVMLLLLSLYVLPRMRRGGKKRSTKALATLACLLLMIIYVVGTAYSLGTLSFLSSTSVKNSDSVARITKDPFNVVITGMDVDGTIDSEGRSDVNMVLTVNPKTAQLLMTSIPRDYQITMVDKDNAIDKLTHTGFYSVQSTIMAEEDLLGINANYYVKVNFTTVEKFIDAIGGVDVYSDYEFEPTKYKGWTVQEGMNHMDGEQALAFARERKAFDDGDRQRVKNQQAVFEAMFKKATSSSTMLMNYSVIISELKDYVEMSFSSKEIRSLVKHQISKNLKWNIYRNTLTGGDDLMPLYTTGGEYAYVMSRDEDSIAHAKELIQAVMKGETLTKDEDGNVNVLNAEEGGEEGEDAETETEDEGEGE